MRILIYAVCTIGCLLVSGANLLAAVHCDHRIDPDTTKADGRANFRTVKAGDTVCLIAGIRRRLVLENFFGMENSPITFLNYGGKVVITDTSKYGIVIRNSRYLRLSGAGDSSHRHGIHISGVDTGVRAGWKSSNMEFDNLEVEAVTGQGILTSSKSSCEDGSNNTFDFDGDGVITFDRDDIISQSNFTQFNTIVHDNYLHDIGDEALYIGSNRNVYAIYGQGKPTNCPQGQANPLHPLLKGVQIYSNVIERTGRDAINVKGAPVDCQVFRNKITEDSMARLGNGQDGGIDIGLNSRCDVYENTIQSGYGRGLSISGLGGRIFNNLITDPGRGFPSDDRRGSGIHVHMGTSGVGYEIFLNTIINPRSYGIRFSYRVGKDHVIRDNFIVNPGANSDSAAIAVTSKAAPVKVLRNWIE